VLTSLLPALVDRDVEEFGAALTRIQELVGDAFASVQGGRFHPRAGALVEALLRSGAAGAGQSSWGPAVYGIVGDEASGRELAERIAQDVGDEGSVELVAFDNRGALVERS
jgi:predicted sugar kinase